MATKPTAAKTPTQPAPMKPDTPVRLECIYARGQYPRLGLRFINGHATIRFDQLEKVKNSVLWGKEFALQGHLKAGRATAVRVVRSSSTAVSLKDGDSSTTVPNAEPVVEDVPESDTPKADDSPL